MSDETFNRNPLGHLGYRLKEELDLAISPAVVLSLVDDSVSDIVITFDVALSSAQRTAAQSIIDAHDATPSSDVKLWDFISHISSRLSEPPVHVNYRGPQIRPKLYMEPLPYRGHITTQNFYADSVDNPNGTVSGIDLVVREEYVYTDDGNGNPFQRTLTPYYQRKDGTEVAGPVRLKKYNHRHRFAVGRRRRSYLIDYIGVDLVGYILATGGAPDFDTAKTLAQTLFLEYAGDVSSFIQASIQTLYTRLQAEPAHTWLDGVLAPGLTVRDRLLDELNIWGL